MYYNGMNKTNNVINEMVALGIGMSATIGVKA